MKRRMDGYWLPGWINGREGSRERWRKDGRRRPIFVLCSTSCELCPVYDPCSEELQTKYDLRYAKLPNLLVACAVTFNVFCGNTSNKLIKA